MKPVFGFRPYRHGDFDEIEPRADFAAEQAAMGWPLRKAPPPGFAWTLLRDGRPVGCGGVVHDRTASVWRAWTYLSDLPWKQWGAVLVACRKVLAFVDREAGVNIEASALYANIDARRMLNRLGFEFEGAGFTHADEPYVRLLREPT